MTRSIVLSFLLIFGTQLLLGQKAIPRATNQLVNDFGGMLTSGEEELLTRKLNKYAQETSTQIVIVTEESLEGEEIFEYSVQLAEEWGIGKSGKDNGVLIYIAKQERELRIQTGYGSEGFLPDALAKRIIENIIIPAFRVGRVYDGLNEATNVIMDLGRGEFTGDEWEKGNSNGIVPFILILLMLIILIAIFSNSDSDDDDDGGYYRDGRYDMNRRRRKRRGGGGWIILPGGFDGGGGGFDGGGFGGLGGGGFGGFGGGGFGGGGAGGSW